ncbi:hypothetical protein Tco_0838070 [Tanacetum coccineum]
MQATMSNQTNELKNMMASFFQMNTASSSGSGPLPSNTIANPKGELKAITTRSVILDKQQRGIINMIDIYNISYEDYLEDLFTNEKITNHLSGNPTFSSEPDTLTSDLTSPEVKDDIFDPEGDIVLIEKLINLDSTKNLPPSPNINQLSGSPTSSSPSLTTSEIRVP